MTSAIGRSAIRIGAMAGKEVLHITRDPRTLLLALAMPIVLLLIFGYGVSYDLDHIPLAVADGDRTPQSRALVDAFVRGGEFDDRGRVAPEEAERLFRRGRALATLVVRPNYGRDLLRGDDTQVDLIVDAADSTTANQIVQKADAVALAQTQLLAEESGFHGAPPIELRTRIRYNPEGLSAIYMVPGITAYLMALIAVLLTALTVAGEWERGSMEQLFASPVSTLEIILGKLLPYLLLGLVQLLVVVAAGMTAFGVPFRGSAALLVLFALVFLVAMLGQGLFISVVAKNQLVATQAGVLSSFIPSLVLSGAFFPIDNMPLPLRWLSAIIPSRYLVHGLRCILLKGAGLDVLWPDLLAMSLFAAAVLAIATVRFTRRVA